MSKYQVRFTVPTELTVTLDAEDEDAAADRAWELANEYANTVLGDLQHVRATMSLDGIGDDEVTEVSS